MSSIPISCLPETQSSSLSDTFDVFSLSSSNIIQQNISFSEISGFFFSAASMEELYEKFNELTELIESFKKFIKDNYLTSIADISGFVSTNAYFVNIFENLETIEKVKKEILDDYATIDYAEKKKAQAYVYHERLASGLGTTRGALLGSVTIPDSN